MFCEDLDLYFSKLPEGAFQRNIFYCKPLTEAPADEESPWFTPTPVGKNTRSKMVSDMCSEAGIIGKKLIIVYESAVHPLYLKLVFQRN